MVATHPFPELLAAVEEFEIAVKEYHIDDYGIDLLLREIALRESIRRSFWKSVFGWKLRAWVDLVLRFSAASSTRSWKYKQHRSFGRQWAPLP